MKTFDNSPDHRNNRLHLPHFQLDLFISFPKNSRPCFERHFANKIVCCILVIPNAFEKNFAFD